MALYQEHTHSHFGGDAVVALFLFFPRSHSCVPALLDFFLLLTHPQGLVLDPLLVDDLVPVLLFQPLSVLDCFSQRFATCSVIFDGETFCVPLEGCPISAVAHIELRLPAVLQFVPEHAVSECFVGLSCQ